MLPEEGQHMVVRFAFQQLTDRFIHRNVLPCTKILKHSPAFKISITQVISNVTYFPAENFPNPPGGVERRARLGYNIPTN
jgi:hypothetical protein